MISDSRHKFVEEDKVSQHLKCMICTEIFHKPVRLTLCRHSFCKQCLEQWLNKQSQSNKNPRKKQYEGGHCPLCRTDINYSKKSSLNQVVQTDLFANQMVGSLKVYCPLCDEKWQGPLENLESHLTNCKKQHQQPENQINQLTAQLQKINISEEAKSQSELEAQNFNQFVASEDSEERKYQSNEDEESDQEQNEESKQEQESNSEENDEDDEQHHSAIYRLSLQNHPALTATVTQIYEMFDRNEDAAFEFISQNDILPENLGQNYAVYYRRIQQHDQQERVVNAQNNQFNQYAQQVQARPSQAQLNLQAQPRPQPQPQPVVQMNMNPNPFQAQMNNQPLVRPDQIAQPIQNRELQIAQQKQDTANREVLQALRRLCNARNQENIERVTQQIQEINANIGSDQMKVDTILRLLPFIASHLLDQFPDINAVRDYERSEEIRRTSEIRRQNFQMASELRQANARPPQIIFQNQINFQIQAGEDSPRPQLRQLAKKKKAPKGKKKK